MSGRPWWLSGKESTCNAGDLGLIPGSGRCPGGGLGNALQYSCLGSPMDRGAWQAVVHGVATESDMTPQWNNKKDEREKQQEKQTRKVGPWGVGGRGRHGGRHWEELGCEVMLACCNEPLLLPLRDRSAFLSFFPISLIIYLSLAVQGLGCGSGAFSGCGERGLCTRFSLRRLWEHRLQ